MLTDKTATIGVMGRCLTLYNQRHPGWTHPYPYLGHETLRTSGCGIFALCHASQWLTGRVTSPEALADFSVAHGARGDDGTDRPALLAALNTANKAADLGFACPDPALSNDLAALYAFLSAGKGVALANLRVGHIVCLTAARQVDGAAQLLAIDSYGEACDPRLSAHVRDVEEGSAFRYEQQGQIILTHAAYWVDATLPRDFQLLYRLSLQK